MSPELRSSLLLVACVLLLTRGASTSAAAILQGTVRDGVTGEPIVGACIFVDGTQLGDASCLDGEYTVLNLPDSTGTATASCIGYSTVTARVNAAPGCTTRQDFLLFPSGFDTTKLSRSAESLFNSLGLDAVHTATVDAPLSTNDTAAISRNNRIRLDLQECYLRGGGYRAAERFEARPPRPAYVPSSLRGSDAVQFRPSAWLAVGREVCFYRYWHYLNSDVIIGPDDHLSEVTGMTAGYFRRDSAGKWGFVRCRRNYPKDKWLVLKLDLHNGGTAFF